MRKLVLIVDDVRPLAEQYAYDLERLGRFRTRVAGGGAEGLDILAREVVRLRDPRPGDARPRRLRRAAGHRAPGDRRAGHRLHRDRQLRPLRGGGAPRGLRVCRQGRTDGTRRARGPSCAPSDRPAGPARPAGRAGVGVLAADRRERSNVAAANRHRTAGAHSQSGAGAGRERHREGAGCAGAAPAEPATRRGVRRGQLRWHVGGTRRQRSLRA